MIIELNRIGRITSAVIETPLSEKFQHQLSLRLDGLDWIQTYIFCERIYDKLLQATQRSYDEYDTLDDVRTYFAKEINLLLDEEGLAYTFVDGRFIRRGSAQTQIAFARVGTVLSDTRLNKVKLHFNKAREFFNKRPEPDVENCVKEALCSLEACVEILTRKQASKDFERAIRQLQGNEQEKIPAPIGESMIKLHGYRGSGQGVAHAALEGARVSPDEAELILSLVASYITYLYNLYIQEDEFPF
jgi:hypothetical protein